MEFIFKKRGHSPATDRLRNEQNQILQPQRTRIVRKRNIIERVQEYPRANKAGNRLNG